MFENLPGCKELTKDERLALLKHLENKNMNRQYYKLEGKNVIPCDYEEWFEILKEDWVIGKWIMGSNLVSTVFVGYFQNFAPEDTRFFETNITCGGKELLCIRSTTYDEALDNHAMACESVKNGCVENGTHDK